MATTAIASAQHGTTVERMVDDFLASCRARGLSPATLHRGYGHPLRRVLLPWCAEHGIRSVDELTQRELDRFTSDLLTENGLHGRTLSRVSVHSYARTVSQFLKWCAAEGEVAPGRPQLPRLPRRVVDVLSRDEIAAMEHAMPTERDQLIIRLLADTGMRVGELCALRPEDLHWRDRRAYLKVRGKGSQERLVPVSPQLVRRIERYIRTRPSDTTSDRLFLALRRAIRSDFKPLSTSGVLQAVHGAAERAGIKKRVHPHLLRHSFATEAIRSGMNPIQLSMILGHNSLRMIERVYSHLVPSDAYDAMLQMLTGTAS